MDRALVFNSLCLAPSIDDAGGKKRAGLFERRAFRNALNYKPVDEAAPEANSSAIHGQIVSGPQQWGVELNGLGIFETGTGIEQHDFFFRFDPSLF